MMVVDRGVIILMCHTLRIVLMVEKMYTIVTTQNTYNVAINVF